MALLQIGAAGGGIMSALGSNSIASALGISTGSSTPLTFATKFGTQSIFTASSLPYVIRTNKNFDVIFHWYPQNSQIRSYFANAFSAEDTDELTLFIRSITMPSLLNQASNQDIAGLRLGSSLPGKGVGTANRANALTMDILSTEFSLVDHCFYQWMREVESPYWIYGPTKNDSVGNDYQTIMKGIMGAFNDGTTKTVTDSEGKEKSVPTLNIKATATNTKITDLEKLNDTATALISQQSMSELVPFTRADIEIKYYSGNQTPLHSVIFYGAFPVSIELMSVDHTAQFKESHKVTFACDSIDISSPFVADGTDSGDGYITNSLNEAIDNTFLKNYNNTAKWTAGLQEDIVSNYANAMLAKASRLINKTTNKAGGKLTDTLSSAQKSLGV